MADGPDNQENQTSEVEAGVSSCLGRQFHLRFLLNPPVIQITADQYADLQSAWVLETMLYLGAQLEVILVMFKNGELRLWAQKPVQIR